MDKRQEDLRSTFAQLSELFKTYSAAIAPFPFFAAAVTSFNETCTAIDKIIGPQEADITGLADDKDAKRKVLESCLLTFSQYLVAFAKDKEDAVLIKKFRITPSHLSRLPQNKLVPLADMYLDFVKDHTADVLPFLIDDELVKELRDKMTPFKEAIPKPKIGKVDKSNLTKDLDKNFTRNEKELEKISSFMPLVKSTSPVFFESFFILHKVVPHGTGKLALKGKTLHASTGDALPNVTLIIEKVLEANGVVFKKKVKKTSELGNFNVRSLPEGKYTLTVKKLGFVTQVIHFNVVAGERVNLDIRLVAE